MFLLSHKLASRHSLPSGSVDLCTCVLISHTHVSGYQPFQSVPYGAMSEVHTCKYITLYTLLGVCPPVSCFLCKDIVYFFWYLQLPMLLPHVLEVPTNEFGHRADVVQQPAVVVVAHDASRQ